MHIYSIGINHRSAPISLREALHLDEQKQRALLARSGCGAGAGEKWPRELVVLSTCNRVELYACSPDLNHTILESFLAEAAGVDRSTFEGSLYRLTGHEVSRHLFRVAAGLDSLVLGEPQILGQVVDAYALARRAGSAGPVLSRLFQAAIHTGKRARTETRISHNHASVSSVAVSMAAGSIGEVEAARVVVVGAGEMAELAVEAFRKRGVSDLVVVNRTISRARELANRWNAEARSFEALGDLLQEGDIIITSTGAPHTIIDREMARSYLDGCRERPLVIIDIAVPRDVDPAVAELPYVQLYDLDHLQAHVAGTFEERQKEVPRVEMLIEEELAQFTAWMERLAVTPLITALHEQAERIRIQVVERSMRKLPRLGDTEREQIEILSRILVKKLLNAPTLCLKEKALDDCLPIYAMVTRQLFGLEGDAPQLTNFQNSAYFSALLGKRWPP